MSGQTYIMMCTYCINAVVGVPLIYHQYSGWRVIGFVNPQCENTVFRIKIPFFLFGFYLLIHLFCKLYCVVFSLHFIYYFQYYFSSILRFFVVYFAAMFIHCIFSFQFTNSLVFFNLVSNIFVLFSQHF